MSEKFQIVIDKESKEALLSALKHELNLAERVILDGDYSEDALINYERALRVHRGILYSKPIIEPQLED